MNRRAGSGAAQRQPPQALGRGVQLAQRRRRRTKCRRVRTPQEAEHFRFWRGEPFLPDPFLRRKGSLALRPALLRQRDPEPDPTAGFRCGRRIVSPAETTLRPPTVMKLTAETKLEHVHDIRL